MDLRRYMRGLGIGILVTAVIMGFAGTKSAAMSDEEIKEKARTLGMTDNVVLAEALPISEPVPETAPEPVEEPETTPEPTVLPTVEPSPDTTADPSPEPTVEPVPGPTAEPDPTTAPAVSPTPEATPALGDNLDDSEATEITIRINSGDDSFKVSSRLEEAGLVTSASDFNKYLMDGGYSRKLRTGNHTIMSNDDYETMARILTGQR